MKTTPKSLRLHIALFGRTNVGKSSFLNLIAQQDVAIVSDCPGTTTDVVEKAMELLPIGPVVFLDTAGIDDQSKLSDKRIIKTEQVFERADVIVLVCEGERLGHYEHVIEQRARQAGIPVIVIANKADLYSCSSDRFIACNATDRDSREQVLTRLKAALLAVCPDEFIKPPPLIGDLVKPGGLVILIVPVDLQAPKGRLILPQVATIRDLLDHDAPALVVKETAYVSALAKLGVDPDLVVCDSQVVKKVVAETPAHIPCTTFSILFARLKGNLKVLAQGAGKMQALQADDQVLIAESCSHHATEDDIGRVKIPHWLNQYCGCELRTDVYAGRDFPDNLSDYSLVVQCGGCMHNRRSMLSRIEKCAAAGVPVTNYGMCISQTQGVLQRVLSPFPAALAAFAGHDNEN